MGDGPGSTAGGRAKLTSTLGSPIAARSRSANSLRSVPGRIRQFRLARASEGITFSLYPAARIVGVQVVRIMALKFGFAESTAAQWVPPAGSSSFAAHADISPGSVGASPVKKARVVGLS